MSVKQTAKEIKTLKIQGARNIALRGLKALGKEIRKSKAKTLKAFNNDFDKKANLLANARPTEPALRNGLTYAKNSFANAKSAREAKRLTQKACQDYVKAMEQASQKIVEIGAKRILSGMTIMTHCHSSTVTKILIKAKAQKKKFKVICTETRPFYQGRITAKELVAAGIDTTMIVDSAVRKYVNNVDLVLVGADAFTADAHLVNKIGTSMVAALAREARTPFAVACETFKFDPLTISGEYEPIEERSTKEIWDHPPKKLKIMNPVFDVVRPHFINYVITEEGIIPAAETAHILRQKWGKLK